MKFEKRTFMGIELDVLVGHPEHELLFVATQVARAAGLKNPSHAVCSFGHQKVGQKVRMSDSEALSNLDRDRRFIPDNSWLFDEPRVYQMLLRGHAPASEPFRKWVTEEVLPTIRKTGSYSAEQSTNPIAVVVMDELKALRGEVGELKALIRAMGSVVAVSPYEGTTKGTVHYHVDSRMIREAADVIGLSRPTVDKLMPRVVLRCEATLMARWDGPKLDTETSTTQRVWTLYPTNWLKLQLTRAFVREALQEVLNEAVK